MPLGGTAKARSAALPPDRPVVRGTAHNPDTYFQAREAINPYYDACPGIIKSAMARLYERTGRQYNLFDYFGDPEAERVIVLMGSSVLTARAILPSNGPPLLSE